MARQPSPLIESLARNWQLLLIASLPGSVLRVWAVISEHHGAKVSVDALERSALDSLLLWSGDNALLTLLFFPILTVVAALAYEAYSRRAGGDGAPRARPAVVRPVLSLDKLSAAARELLCTASFGGMLQLERRRTGLAVIATGSNGERGDWVCEFHSDTHPEVAQRYRAALAELEAAGYLARHDDGFRPTPVGLTAAKFLNRCELDRIAARARHLDELEVALLRIVAQCEQQYRAHKVALYRDGTRVCAIFGNGETVVVPGLTPLAVTHANGAEARPKERSFEQLVQGIPSCYLAALPGQLPRNPFLVRLTDTGLRYLRHAEVIERDRAAA